MNITMHVSFRGQPQKRHRHSRGRMYDPSAADKKQFLQLCMRQHAPYPLLGALRCRLMFTFVRPKSHLTTKGVLRKGAPVLHVYKPDSDNLAKFVLDALNGTYYHDDSQIYDLSVQKRYGDVDSVLVELLQEGEH